MLRKAHIVTPCTLSSLAFCIISVSGVLDVSTSVFTAKARRTQRDVCFCFSLRRRKTKRSSVPKDITCPLPFSLPRETRSLFLRGQRQRKKRFTLCLCAFAVRYHFLLPPRFIEIMSRFQKTKRLHRAFHLNNPYFFIFRQTVVRLMPFPVKRRPL
ncbi:MAG: hypothetical protein QG552_129 [Thermodesulfobacteriota bacterium]|nr:hypothetical protein [Thermodesulfobacteriota bacterium]